MIEFAPRSSKLMTYDEAVLYCQFLDYGGHKDWRIPTHSEWLYEMGATNCWHQERMHLPYHPVQWFVIPVREI
jgi:hypothetical protein